MHDCQILGKLENRSWWIGDVNRKIYEKLGAIQRSLRLIHGKFTKFIGSLTNQANDALRFGSIGSLNKIYICYKDL